uniref:SMB domain-containing protein n=1 Tax=Oryzias melastigma TaxID=30732 RepID=A0A3B3DAF0_ORYME
FSFSCHSIDCSFDNIRVYDGFSTGSRLLGTYCQFNNSIFYSTGRYLTVRFTSDTHCQTTTAEPTTNMTTAVEPTTNMTTIHICYLHFNTRTFKLINKRMSCFHVHICIVVFCIYFSTDEGSCQHNCGYEAGNCSCSSSCKDKGNCCWDYEGNN